jgi:glucose-6-phosphate isomerase
MLLTLDTQFLSEESLKNIGSFTPLAFEKLNALKEKNCPGSDYTGWWNWPEHSGFETLKQVRDRMLKMDITFDLVIVVGIGGSYAGTKAIAEALRHQFADQLWNEPQHRLPIVYAGHNLNERSLMELLDLMENHEPLLNVISKSGTTTEPNVAFRILEETLHKRFGKEAAKRIFVTTQDDKNSLYDIAHQRHYTFFPIPNDVGGRYSVFTAAGLLPLSLAGYDCEQVLAGADRLFSELRSLVSSDHPVLQYACFRKAAWDEGKVLDVLSYKEPKLAALVEWYKQLFAESEGKQGKGLMPMGMSYTTDLHSLGQFMQEGPSCMIQSFLNVGTSPSLIEKKVRIPADTHPNKTMTHLWNRYVQEIDEAAWLASQQAHSERGVPCIELKLTQLDEYHLGYLLAFFQCACAVSALLLDVNPFDQPGVEVYKRKLHEILKNLS